MLTLAKPLQSAKGEMTVCKSDTWLTKLVLTAHKNAFLRKDYMYQYVCNIPRIWMASSAICVAASAVYRITAAQS